MFRSGSGRSEVRGLMVVAAFLRLSSVLHALPLMDRELEETERYSTLRDLVDRVIVSDLVKASSSPSLAAEDLADVVLSDILSRTAADTSLADVIRSAVKEELTELMGTAGSFPSPEEEEIEVVDLSRPGRNGVMMKRGFDSISQSSSFGSQKNSWGSAHRDNDNLSFTFESLFPAIARGLRSTK